MVRLMSEPTPDPYFQEKRDSLDAEDYRDATQGGCGFPWEKESEESEWYDSISRDAHFHIAQIAFGMVEALAGSWRDTTGSEYAEFLKECGLNSEWVSKYIPEGTPSDEMSLY
jgi:hypothetical protein